MEYTKWADSIGREHSFKCSECGGKAVCFVFEPDRNAEDGCRRVAMLCELCLPKHPEIYDTRYEDHCIAGMTVERIKEGSV